MVKFLGDCSKSLLESTQCSYQVQRRQRELGFNFNVVCCESCKTFFRRHALKFNVPTCTRVEKCDITITTRKYCMACRMEKFLTIGMDKNIIFSRNCRRFRCKEDHLEIVRIFKNSTELKGHEMNCLIEVRSAVSVFQDESNFTLIGEAKSTIEMANLYQNYVRNVIKFCKDLSALKSLKQSDQLILFKNFFPELSFVRVAFFYDQQNDGFPVVSQCKSERKALFVRASLILNCLQPKAQSLWRRIIYSLNCEMENDFIVRNLITGLLLFKQRDNLEQREHIHYHYMRYNYLLKRYLEQKYSNVERANEKYRKLMSSVQLTDRVIGLMKIYYSNIQRSQSPEQIAQVLREIYDF